MTEKNRRMFVLPLTLALFMSVALELFSFAIFTNIGAMQGSSLTLFIWMVGCGGIGMGAILGILIDLIIVGRLSGKEAIQGTMLLSVLTTGVVAKLLSINLLPMMGMPLGINSALFFSLGISTALVGGWVLGQLLFSAKGNARLAQLGF